MRKVGVLLTTILILVTVNYSTWRTEQHLAHGQTVILELAPVDPRSLMQGDYMALSFDLGNQVEQQLLQKRTEHNQAQGSANNEHLQWLSGRVIVAADEQGVARFVAMDDGQPLQEGQLALQYRLRDRRIQFASNAFFFEEGTAKTYEKARYGLFRVNEKGQPLLTRLLDADLQELGAAL